MANGSDGGGRPGGRGVALGHAKPDTGWFGHGTLTAMTVLLIVVIVLFALGILGTVVKGLLWLTFLAAVAIVAAVAYGWFRLRPRSD